MFDGLHPALISEEDFQLAQQIRLRKQPNTKVKKEFELQNPFAGLIFCTLCGKRIGRTTMSAAQNNRARLRCVNSRNCHNVSSDYDIVEQEIINALRTWLEGYRVKIDTVGYADDIANCKTQLERLSQEAAKLQMQLDNAYNLVEQGVYTLELFRTRREKLTDALDEIRQRQATIEETLHKLESSEVTQTSLIPQTEALLASYDHMTNQERNALLKAILHRIEYAKGADGKIEIDLYPRLPKL